jgi:putative transposase
LSFETQHEARSLFFLGSRAMQYRRSQAEGGTFFFTVACYRRQKIFAIPQNVELLRSAFRGVISTHPFSIDAVVVLPDHLHCVWKLPKGDSDFAMRWRLIKSAFSRRCSWEIPKEIEASRMKKGERMLWQRRYWEHTIRDDSDFMRHLEYIHYNPVKHGYVNAPQDWPYSSFHRYVREGVYDQSWGQARVWNLGPLLGTNEESSVGQH